MYPISDRFEFYRKFAEIFAAEGAPPGVIATGTNDTNGIVGKFSGGNVIDTSGKFAADVVDTGEAP